jgi:hypothetical protein
MLLESVQKMCKLGQQGGKSGIGVEVVMRKEFNRRKQALEEEKGAPMQRNSWGLARHQAYQPREESQLLNSKLFVLCSGFSGGEMPKANRAQHTHLTG